MCEHAPYHWSEAEHAINVACDDAMQQVHGEEQDVGNTALEKHSKHDLQTTVRHVAVRALHVCMFRLCSF